MNTKKKVYESLSKDTKKIKTELSLTDDLEKWNDFNGLDDLAFNEINDVKEKIREADIALDNFENENLKAEESYQEVFSYLNSDVLRGMLSEGIELVGDFEALAEELGVDPNSNEAYITVKEQITTNYPNLIGLYEEVEQSANNYFGRTSGI